MILCGQVMAALHPLSEHLQRFPLHPLRLLHLHSITCFTWWGVRGCSRRQRCQTRRRAVESNRSSNAGNCRRCSSWTSHRMQPLHLQRSPRGHLIQQGEAIFLSISRTRAVQLQQVRALLNPQQRPELPGAHRRPSRPAALGQPLQSGANLLQYFGAWLR